MTLCQIQTSLLPFCSYSKICSRTEKRECKINWLINFLIYVKCTDASRETNGTERAREHVYCIWLCYMNRNDCSTFIHGCDAEFGCENSGTLFKTATEVIFRKFKFFLSTHVRWGISRLELQTAHTDKQSHALFSHYTISALCGQITKKKSSTQLLAAIQGTTQPECILIQPKHIHIFRIWLNGVEISRIFAPRFHSLSHFKFSLMFWPGRVRVVCTHSTLHVIPRALRNINE